MHFVTFFFLCSRPWKVTLLRIYSLLYYLLGLYFFSILRPSIFGLKPISNAWVIIYFQATVSPIFIQGMNHFSKKLQVVYFLTMMVFVLKKQSEVNFSLVCRVGFFWWWWFYIFAKRYHQKNRTKMARRSNKTWRIEAGSIRRIPYNFGKSTKTNFC